MVRMPKRDYLENLPMPDLSCLEKEPFKEYLDSIKAN